jgi:hypothetical protein
MKKYAKLTNKNMTVYASKKWDKNENQWFNPKPYTVKKPTHGLTENILIHEQLKRKPSLHGKEFAWSYKLRTIL